MIDVDRSEVFEGVTFHLTLRPLLRSCFHRQWASFIIHFRFSPRMELEQVVRLQMVWDNLSCLGTEALARLG
jgi:hypothetical protein